LWHGPFSFGLLYADTCLSTSLLLARFEAYVSVHANFIVGFHGGVPASVDDREVTRMYSKHSVCSYDALFFHQNVSNMPYIIADKGCAGGRCAKAFLLRLM